MIGLSRRSQPASGRHGGGRRHYRRVGQRGRRAQDDQVRQQSLVSRRRRGRKERRRAAGPATGLLLSSRGDSRAQLHGVWHGQHGRRGVRDHPVAGVAPRRPVGPAACLALRELARNATISFYGKTQSSDLRGSGNALHESVFPILRDPQPIVRACAADALSECLRIAHRGGATASTHHGDALSGVSANDGGSGRDGDAVAFHKRDRRDREEHRVREEARPPRRGESPPQQSCRCTPPWWYDARRHWRAARCCCRGRPEETPATSAWPRGGWWRTASPCCYACR